MAKFEVERDGFNEFIQAVICKGIMNVENNKVKEGDFFIDFLISVKEDGIFITATDTKQHKLIAQHVFKIKNDSNKKGAVIVEEGEIPITNVVDLTEAMDLCGRGKGIDIYVQYPNEENKVVVGRTGTKTAWQFPTQGKKQVMSLTKCADINHKWNDESKQVVSISKKSGNELKWPQKVMVLPEEISDIAKANAKFVKEKMVSLSLKGNEMLLALGKITSDRKGTQQVVNISRMVMGDGGWEDGNDAEDVESKFFHGFYAVLQNIPNSCALELHFAKFGLGFMCWARAFNGMMELNYCIPFEIEKK